MKKKSWWKRTLSAVTAAAMTVVYPLQLFDTAASPPPGYIDASEWLDSYTVNSFELPETGTVDENGIPAVANADMFSFDLTANLVDGNIEPDTWYQLPLYSSENLVYSNDGPRDVHNAGGQLIGQYIIEDGFYYFQMTEDYLKTTGSNIQIDFSGFGTCMFTTPDEIATEDVWIGDEGDTRTVWPDYKPSLSVNKSVERVYPDEYDEDVPIYEYTVEITAWNDILTLTDITDTWGDYLSPLEDILYVTVSYDGGEEDL